MGQRFNGTVSVDPITSPYLPRSGCDLIIGNVAEVRKQSLVYGHQRIISRLATHVASTMEG